MTLLSAQKISYSINDKKLFHGLSFNVQNGEALHVKGSNGSGKSTLLRILLGITPPSKGQIERSNPDLKISYLGHKNAIKNYLTPAQNLELLFNESELGIALKWLRELDLSSVQEELTSNLSFGQKKKLALIRVLAKPQELIVLDEPFVGLDQDASQILNNFLVNQLSNQASLIFTSHIHPDVECKVLNLSNNSA